MARLRTLILYPDLDEATREFGKAYDYLLERFPSKSWRARESGEFLICNKYYIRFDSMIHESAKLGFRGEIISENQDWKKILDEIFKDDIIDNEEYPAIDVAVLCFNEEPKRCLEKFAEDVRNITSDYGLNWAQHIITMKGYHRVHFIYPILIEQELKSFEGVIFTDRSFRKYKDKILEALKDR